MGKNIKITTWEHKPKLGEEYQGWFAEAEVNGTKLTEGGFLSPGSAKSYLLVIVKSVSK